MALQLVVVNLRAVGAVALDVLGELDGGRRGDEATIDATDERVCAQTVRAVDGVVALARGEKAGNGRPLLEIYSQPAHRIMPAEEDAHRDVARVVADEHLVNFQNRAELLVESLGRDVRQVEVDLILAVDAVAVETDLEDFARRNVAGDEVAVGWILLFEEVPALRLGDGRRLSLVALRLRHPHAPALAARRLGHQAQLVLARNRSRVHLDALAVGLTRALLVAGRDGRAGADHRGRRLTEDEPRPARRDDDGVGGESLQLKRRALHRHQAPADAVVVLYEREHLPVLVLLHLAGVLVPAHLLVQSVKKLLTRRGTGKRRAVVERAASDESPG